MAHFAVEGELGNWKKRGREKEEEEETEAEEEDLSVVVLCDHEAREMDDAKAPAMSLKRQCIVEWTRSPDPCSNEYLSPINGSSKEEQEQEEAREKNNNNNKAESSSVLRELEDCLIVGDEQVGSSESAVSEENAARVLRSLEEELGLSESEGGGQTAVSSLLSAATAAVADEEEEAPPNCTAAFATPWPGDDVWNMHGFSSADLSVGCSSGSTLTADDFVCDPLLNQDHDNDDDLCFRLHDGVDGVVSDARLDGTSSAAGDADDDDEKGRFDVDGDDYTGKESTVLNESGGSIVTPGTAAVVVGTSLEGLHNAISWALEEGFDDYSGFSHIAVNGEDWITSSPEEGGNLDFLLDSTAVFAAAATTTTATTTTSAARPFILEEGVPL